MNDLMRIHGSDRCRDRTAVVLHIPDLDLAGPGHAPVLSQVT
ncbi:hypothetical protein GFS60_07057 (plasmid) [Rhodococcus sp. WAY2]|nr:hypothetical protein GFS60_07057 [Rhodococcus sp. WAY2]